MAFGSISQVESPKRLERDLQSGDNDKGASKVGFKQVGASTDRTVSEKFSETVSVKDFGAVGNGVTDDTIAIQNALNSGASEIIIPNGSYLIDCSGGTGLTAPANITIRGSGKLLGSRTSGAVVNVLLLGANNKLYDISIMPFQTDSSRVDNTSLTTQDADSNASFSYNSYLIGLGLSSNCIVKNVGVYNLWRGIGASGANNLLVDGCTTYQIGEWHTQFYNCRYVQFVNNTAEYGGASGGCAFSSSKYLTINNNYLKVVGTGINPGGASAVGFNVENVTITGNTIIARDCINLENGAINFTVTGNNIRILTDYNLAGNNGVGISNTSSSGGVFGGDCYNGVISANKIISYESNNYALGISISVVGVSSGANEIGRYTVSNNVIENGSTSIYIGMSDNTVSVKDVIVSNNIIRNSGSKGIQLINVENVRILGNNIDTGASAIFSNYYAVQVIDVINARIDQNIFAGYGYGVYVGSPNKTSDVIVTNNTLKPNKNSLAAMIGLITDDGNFTTSLWFTDASSTVTDTNTRLSLRSAMTYYSPGSSITCNGLSGYSCYPAGQVLSVEFNGNVTLSHNPPYTYLKNGVATTPAAGKRIQFVSHADNRLTEISRDY